MQASFQWGEREGKLEMPWTSAWWGEPSLSATRGVSCLQRVGVPWSPRCGQLLPGNSRGKQGPGPSMRMSVRAGTWGPRSVPLTQLKVCKAHSHGLVITNYGFHFYKPVWFPYPFSTYAGITCCEHRECQSARQTLHLPSQNLWLVGIQIIIIHNVPVYLIECSIPYVAWDKIAPNYPPK